MRRPPRADVALDPGGVGAELGAEVLDVQLLKQTDRRLVVRYELADGRSVVGKWFSTDRGAVVADALTSLRRSGFHGVPALVGYATDLRALFVEAVDAPLLRELLRSDQQAAARAGEWLGAFHASAFHSSRSCGPGKQRRSLSRWCETVPELADAAPRLDSALSELADPGRPVHYDYYHSQVLVPPAGGAVVLDLDEAGLGDPRWDLAHFEAHLALLALQWHGDPGGFSEAVQAFRGGYGAVEEPPSALVAYAWFKLAYQLLRRRAPPAESAYAVSALERSLSAA